MYDLIIRTGKSSYSLAGNSLDMKNYPTIPTGAQVFVPKTEDLYFMCGPQQSFDLDGNDIFTTFVNNYTRNNLNDIQKTAIAQYLRELVESGILNKTRQLFIPCVMGDWQHCLMNVARYFNENKIEFINPANISNEYEQCFDLCDYGIYKVNSEISGDSIVYDWIDTDVTFNNWHILVFKPAYMDANTSIGCGNLNFRGSKGDTPVSFTVDGATSSTLRMRGTWTAGTIQIGDTKVKIKDELFTFPEGWGNGTHDPYCVGLSIKDNQLIMPSSNYEEYNLNNKNLVNEINVMDLTGQYELPTTPMTGTYSWGGYRGNSISTQKSLATSIISIGQGLTADEMQAYMDKTNTLMSALNIKNDNWDPDRLNIEE